MLTFIDPCTTHSTIQNQEKRSAGYQFEMSSDDMINDFLLTNDWYRVISSIGDDMPTEPPDSLKCGTWYPIWLNGMNFILITSMSFYQYLSLNRY